MSASITKVGFVALVLALCAAEIGRADPPAKAHNPSEIREVRDSVEARHRQQLKDIENGLAINAYDSDTALMMRMKANHEYSNRLEVLRQEESAAYNALEASQHRPSDASKRAPSNAALPRFQSQSVITYPQGPQSQGAPAAEEKPQREGEQRNVGFGTRELEF